VPERHGEHRQHEDRPEDADPHEAGVPSDPSEILEGEIEANHGHTEDDDPGDHDADQDVATHHGLALPKGSRGIIPRIASLIDPRLP
jgi:hypothetical protein